MDETSGPVRHEGSLASLGSRTQVSSVESSTNVVRRIGARPSIGVSILTSDTSIDTGSSDYVFLDLGLGCTRLPQVQRYNLPPLESESAMAALDLLPVLSEFIRKVAPSQS